MRPIVVSMVTIPSQQARDFLLGKTFEPDANLSPLDKPPKTITEIKTDSLREVRLRDWKFAQGIKLEQSILTKRQTAIEQAGRRWWTAKVVAISVMEPGSTPVVLSDDDELVLLTSLFSLLTNTYPSHNLVAKGGKDFYIPFLTGRALAYNLGLPPQLFNSYPISDIHEIFGRSSMSTQRGNIEDYAFGIGLKAKDHTESSQFLYDQYQLGSEQALKEIQHRCAEETQIVSEILTRFQKRFQATRIMDTKGNEAPLDIPF